MSSKADPEDDENFGIKAFNFTPADKQEALGEIKSLLFRETMLTQLNEALSMALEPELCDPSDIPFATCYLYEGHIQLGMGDTNKAYEAYERAAKAIPHIMTDFPAQQQAANLVAEWSESTEKRGTKRPFPWPQKSRRTIPDFQYPFENVTMPPDEFFLPDPSRRPDTSQK